MDGNAKGKLFVRFQTNFDGVAFVAVDEVVKVSQVENMPVYIRLTNGNDLAVQGSLDEVMATLKETAKE